MLHIHSFTFILVNLHYKKYSVSILNLFFYNYKQLNLYIKTLRFNFVISQTQIKISANCKF